MSFIVLELTSKFPKPELDRLDAMHKLFLVIRSYKLYSTHIILDNIEMLRVGFFHYCALLGYVLMLRFKGSGSRMRYGYVVPRHGQVSSGSMCSDYISK